MLLLGDVFIHIVNGQEVFQGNVSRTKASLCPTELAFKISPVWEKWRISGREKYNRKI